MLGGVTRYYKDTLTTKNSDSIRINGLDHIQYENANTLLIPEMGNKYLYSYTDNDLDGNNNYPVRFILSTDLYSHILITKQEDIFYNSQSSLSDQGIQVFEISQLERDPNQNNIIIIPLLNQTSKYSVYLATMRLPTLSYPEYKIKTCKFYLLNEKDIPTAYADDGIVCFNQPLINYTDISKEDYSSFLDEDLFELVCLRGDPRDIYGEMYDGYRCFPISSSTGVLRTATIPETNIRVETNVLYAEAPAEQLIIPGNDFVFQHKASGQIISSKVSVSDDEYIMFSSDYEFGIGNGDYESFPHFLISWDKINWSIYNPPDYGYRYYRADYDETLQKYCLYLTGVNNQHLSYTFDIIMINNSSPPSVEVSGNLAVLGQFNNKSFLQTAPDLFKGNQALIDAQNLIIPGTLYCHSMFIDCINLINTPHFDYRDVTEVDQYQFACMFMGCTSLVQSSFYLPVDYAPYAVCQQMFDGCYSLEVLPSLYPTRLDHYCYEGMFAGCSKIKLSTTQDETYIYSYTIPGAGVGSSSMSTSRRNMFANTGGTFISMPLLNTTYYTSNDIFGGPVQ